MRTASATRALPIVALFWLHEVLLGLWLGGILVIGAIVAPAVFGAARSAGHLARGASLYDFAGVALGVVFHRFTVAAMLAGLVVLPAGIIYGAAAGVCPRRIAVRAALVAIAWLLAAWMLFSLFPEMNVARTQQRWERFDELHRHATHHFQLQALLLAAATAFTAWMHLDRSPHQPVGDALGRLLTRLLARLPFGARGRAAAPDAPAAPEPAAPSAPATPPATPER
jgi:hypothetical protein